VAETMTIYVAQELTAGTATPMDDERIECQCSHLHEVETMIEKGQVQDAKTLIGWAWWKLKGKPGKILK
jgi:ADP-ribose pyrophosphatase